MAHIHASAPSPAHPPSHPPSYGPGPSLEDSEPSDRDRLYQRAVNGFADALHALRTRPTDLQHALGRGMRGVTALKRLTSLRSSTADAGASPCRDSTALEQRSPEGPSETAPPTVIPTKKRRRRRHFDEAYKRQVVQVIRQRQISISQASKDFNLTYSAVRRWVDEFDGEPAVGSSTVKPTVSEAERIRALEERLQQLQLKKASAFFAREIGKASPGGLGR